MNYYTYRIDFADGHYYYGAHKIGKLPPEQDGYYGSPVTNKDFWTGRICCKTILFVHTDIDETAEIEGLLIGDLWKTDPMCLNAGYWPYVKKTKHGRTNSVEYDAHKEIKRKCRPGTKHHIPGSTMCERWKGEDGFQNFLTDMKERPGKNYIMTNKIKGGWKCSHFSKETCSWSTTESFLKTQVKNRTFEIDNLIPEMLKLRQKGMCIKHIANELGVKWHSVRDRIEPTPYQAKGHFSNKREKKMLMLMEKAVPLYESGIGINETARRVGINRTTLTKRLKKMGIYKDKSVTKTRSNTRVQTSNK